MKKVTSYGNMDRTAHAIAKLVLNSGGPDRNPSDLISYTDFKDCVDMGFDHTMLSKDNGETLYLSNWINLPGFKRKIIPYAIVTDYSGQYDDRPRRVSLYSYDLECMKTISDYILNLCISDNWDVTSQDVMTSIINGSVMNHVLNETGHRFTEVPEPDDAKCKGVLYSIIFQTDTLVKVLGWNWCISANDEYLITGKYQKLDVPVHQLPSIIYYSDLMTMEIAEPEYDDVDIEDR